RLLAEAKGPLQAVLLHPGWGHPLVAGVEVERGADAKLHRPDPALVLEGEMVLLGQPQADEHQARAAVVDAPNDGLVLFRRERAKWWRFAADDLKTRALVKQALPQPLDHIGRASV